MNGDGVATAMQLRISLSSNPALSLNPYPAPAYPTSPATSGHPAPLLMRLRVDHPERRAALQYHRRVHSLQQHVGPSARTSGATDQHLRRNFPSVAVGGSAQLTVEHSLCLSLSLSLTPSPSPSPSPSARESSSCSAAQCKPGGLLREPFLVS